MPEGAPRDPYIHSRGLRVPKDPRITTGQLRAALREDRYERKECDAVLRVVKRGDRVLELGSGIGYVSALIAAKRAPARVLGYEANPALIPYIRALHVANGVETAEVRHALLAPEAGPPVDFYVRNKLLGSSLDRDSDPDGIVETVPVARHALAEVLAEERPDVLVCDIEGAEATLLPAGDWSCLRAAVIELHPQWIGPAGVRAVFDAMHAAGLTYFPKASEAKVVTFRRAW